MRYKVTFSYDGRNYAGLQSQINALAIQDVIEAALKKIYQEEVKITLASRTDAGVHALGQVFSYENNKEIPENSLAALQNAIDHDYGIEFDLHPLEDGTPVLFHDETLKRMTGEDGYIKKVKDTKELKKYKLLDTNEKIPTLTDSISDVDFLIDRKEYKEATRKIKTRATVQKKLVVCDNSN